MDSPPHHRMDTASPQPQPQPRLMTRIRSSHALSVEHSANTTPQPSASPRPGNAAAKSGAAASWPATAAASPPPINTFSLLALFVLALLGLGLLFRSMPAVSEEERLLLVFPRSLHDVRGLAQVLAKYRDENQAVVVGGFAAIYIFLQAFAIPGAIFLSVLAGPLFGVWRGLLIVSAVATTGSSICYGISSALGRGLVERCFPSMLARLRGMVASHRSNLFFYLLFLRISPLLPNWFISVASPILGIPLRHFVAATFLGLMPANYLHVTTGVGLMELNQAEEADGKSPVNLRALAFLFCVAFLALLPTLCKKQFEKLAGGGSGSSASADPSATATATDNNAQTVANGSAAPAVIASAVRVEEGQATEAPPSSRTRSNKKKTGLKAQ